MSDNSAVLAHHFRDLEQQHEANTLGMWAFLVTEVMIFGGLFTAYAVFRYKFPAAFSAGSNYLNVTQGAINTVVLIGSSLTMALAVHAAQTANRKLLTLFLVLTIVLGTVFLVIKGFEYTHDYDVGLIPGLRFDDKPWLEKGIEPGQGKAFFFLYFCLTGLHAIHMIIGMAILAIMAVLAWRGYYTDRKHDTPVEIMGLYWHFVDIVWIFLFPLLYLIGESHG